MLAQLSWNFVAGRQSISAGSDAYLLPHDHPSLGSSSCKAARGPHVAQAGKQSAQGAFLDQNQDRGCLCVRSLEVQGAS